MIHWFIEPSGDRSIEAFLHCLIAMSRLAGLMSNSFDLKMAQWLDDSMARFFHVRVGLPYQVTGGDLEELLKFARLLADFGEAAGA